MSTRVSENFKQCGRSYFQPVKFLKLTIKVKIKNYNIVLVNIDSYSLIRKTAK